MPTPEIVEFAKLLVKYVRDDSIGQCDINHHAEAGGATALRWKQMDLKAGIKSVANTVVPDVVNDTVFHLLHALDNDELKLSFTASNGKMLYLPEDGGWELAGWYAGIPGWISAYSKERYFDDFADLPSVEYEGMANPELEEFAKSLVKEVRDEAIRSCDRRIHPNARGVIAQRWKKLDPKAGLESVANIMIPDVVDDTIFQLLRAIDEGRLQLSLTGSNGKRLYLPEDGLGKLAKWYMGSSGWRSAYSKERFLDDFADVTIPGVLDKQE